VVWAERFDRPCADILAVRSDILEQIVGRLAREAQDAGGILASSPATSDLAVYELVLRARRAYSQFERQAAFEGYNLVTDAIDIDPGYAAAWELRASLEFQFYIQPYDDRRGSPAQLETAMSSARRAVSLDPHFASALAEFGWIRSFFGEQEEGLADIEAAMETNPANATIVRQYADAPSRGGYQEEALAAWERAAALDPFDVPLDLGLIARSHILLRDFETALALTSECLSKAPQLLPCHLFNIMAASGTGDADALALSVKKVRELAPRFSVAQWAAIVRHQSTREEAILTAHLLDAGLPP
jgi:tetratricopeptide (TPR) repeat protein